MRERNLITLVIIIVITLLSVVIIAPIAKPQFLLNLIFWQDARSRDLQIKQGLDLKGGIQILMSPDVGEGTSVVSGTLESARAIIENRVNGIDRKSTRLNSSH